VKKGFISIEPTIAIIHQDKCSWCDKCSAVCPFDAITKVEVEGREVAKLIEANCKGCGMCLPVCPENAIELHNYTDDQIETMIETLANA